MLVPRYVYIYGSMDGWMDGWMDGCLMDGCILHCVILSRACTHVGRHMAEYLSYLHRPLLLRYRILSCTCTDS